MTTRHQSCNDDKALVHKISNAIRKVWHRYPARQAALDKVFMTEQEYKKDGTPKLKPSQFWICELCEAKCKQHRSKRWPRIHVDHIDPVIPIENNQISWTDFIRRLFFSGESNLQAICETCHKAKTKEENTQRKR
jgi:hypothetical protein